MQVSPNYQAGEGLLGEWRGVGVRFWTPWKHIAYPEGWEKTLWYFTNNATCSWLSLLYPWLFLPYPWLSLHYPWLSLLDPCLSPLSLAVPGIPSHPGVSLALPQLEKRIILPPFAVLVWLWLRQELNSIYQGSSKDCCRSTFLKWLYKCTLCLQRWQDHREIINNMKMT